MNYFYIFLTYLANFGSILALYFISKFNSNLALGLFIVYIGLNILIDSFTQYNQKKLLDVAKAQNETLLKLKHDYDMSCIIGSKLLEKYVEKTGEDDIMEKLMKKIRQDLLNGLENSTKV